MCFRSDHMRLITSSLCIRLFTRIILKMGKTLLVLIEFNVALGH